VLRETGMPPWAFGKRTSRSRLYEAACTLAPALTLLPIYLAIEELKKPAVNCPLFGE